MYFSLLGHVHHFFYLGHQFWAVNKRWFFSWAHQADLSVGMGYRLGLYARWCAEILAVTWFCHFLVFFDRFSAHGGSQNAPISLFSQFQPLWGSKNRAQNPKIIKIIIFHLFLHTNDLSTRALTSYQPPDPIVLREKKSPFVNISDSKSQLSQGETVTHAVRFGISRNSFNFDRLYLRAQEELEARETCFRKP